MTTSTPTLTGTWTLDPVHSDASFKVRHMAVGKAKGTFALVSSTLTIGADGFADSHVVATLDATSVDTGQDQRDAHVRSADFLDTENHQELTFASTGVRVVDAENLVITGDLTIRGTTRSVELETEFLGATTDAYGNERMGFSATTDISRKDYGVSFSAAFGAGNAVVSDKVEIALELEYTLQHA